MKTRLMNLKTPKKYLLLLSLIGMAIATPMDAAPPGIGEFAAGGGSNGNDGFVLLKRSDGHVLSVMDASAKFRFPVGVLEAISDARLVCASRSYGLVVHADGSASVYGFLARGYPPHEIPTIGPDVICVVGLETSLEMLHRDGTVTQFYVSQGVTQNLWTDVSQLSPDGSYAVTHGGKVLSRADDLGTAIRSGISNARAVAANIHQGVALLADGTLVAWDRASGPRGNEGAYNIPHPPAGLTGLTAIAAGDDFFIALKSDGTLTQWGHPITPPMNGVYTAIAASPDYNIVAAVQRDGSVASWHPKPVR
jgi:hypothetical protein